MTLEIIHSEMMWQLFWTIVVIIIAAVRIGVRIDRARDEIIRAVRKGRKS